MSSQLLLRLLILGIVVIAAVIFLVDRHRTHPFVSGGESAYYCCSKVAGRIRNIKCRGRL